MHITAIIGDYGWSKPFAEVKETFVIPQLNVPKIKKSVEHGL
jgi:hypothetical protein